MLGKKEEVLKKDKLEDNINKNLKIKQNKFNMKS